MATKKTDKAIKAAKAATTKGAKGAATRTKATTRATAKPKAPAKKAPAEKKPQTTSQVKVAPRHPRARLLELHGGKAALAKTLAPVLARGDQDTDALEAQLKKASNKQLIRLAAVSETVKKKWGNRDKLIVAIGTAENKSKDKDYLAMLETLSLPNLVALAHSAERRARA
jgi:hypothetical protein